MSRSFLFRSAPLFGLTRRGRLVFASRKDFEFLSLGGMASIGNARVAASPIAGKGLFACADIEPGELIFTIARPAVAALDTVSLDTVCSNCFTSAAEPSILYGSLQETVTVKACTGCKTLRYCSKVRY